MERFYARYGKVMTRIGKKPILIAPGVEVKMEGNKIIVSSGRGTLSKEIDKRVKIKIEEGRVHISRIGDEKEVKSLHGLYFSLISNMIQGVSSGFEKTVELSGVGYKAIKEGKKLILQVGFSHPIEFEPPQGIEFIVEGVDKVKIIGADKELVGSLASQIRSARPAEPYKGKGVKYAKETIRRKAGKAAKAAAGVVGA